MTRLVIQFDIDGVLANFTRAYIREINAVYGLTIPEDREPQSWDELAAWTPDRGLAVWAWVMNHPTFWNRVPPLVEPAVFTRIDQLQLQGHELYFVTSRPGWQAKPQTETWLLTHGIWHATVLMSKKKGEVARALGADYSIEDKAENAWAVSWLSPVTESYLIRRSYNEYDERRIGASRVRKVDTVEQFLDAVERGARHGQG